MLLPNNRAASGSSVFTARCAIVQSAVLRLHVVRASVCLSVRLSVRLVHQDHMHRFEILETNCTDNYSISPTPSLFVAQRPSMIHLLPKEHGEVLRRREMGWGKVVCWSTKAAISLKRVNIEEKLLWRAYKNSPTLFRTVPSRPPTAFSSPRLGFVTPPKTPIATVLFVRNGWSYRLQIWLEHSKDISEQNPIKNFGEKGAWGVSRDFPIFLGTPYYRRNR